MQVRDLFLQLGFDLAPVLRYIIKWRTIITVFKYNVRI